MSNEIKVGDKVRVREDAPRIYTPDWTNPMFNLVLKVTEVEDGNAMVEFEKRTSYRTVLTAIPTKYLVKVDAEEKEARFKVGDKVVRKNVSTVRTIISIDYVDDDEDPAYYYKTVDSQGNNPMDFLESELMLYTEPTEDKIKVGSEYWGGKTVWNCKSHTKGFIKRIFDGAAEVLTEYGENKLWPLMDLVDEYDDPFEKWKPVQPTERTEAEKSFEDQLRDVLNGVEHQDYGHPIHTAMINLDINDWDAYTADIAKEIALKVANKYNDPEEAAEYAVSVAKAVVEGLKRK